MNEVPFQDLHVTNVAHHRISERTGVFPKPGPVMGLEFVGLKTVQFFKQTPHECLPWLDHMAGTGQVTN